MGLAIHCANRSNSNGLNQFLLFLKKSKPTLLPLFCWVTALALASSSHAGLTAVRLILAPHTRYAVASCHHRSQRPQRASSRCVTPHLLLPSSNNERHQSLTACRNALTCDEGRWQRLPCDRLGWVHGVHAAYRHPRAALRSLCNNAGGATTTTTRKPPAAGPSCPMCTISSFSSCSSLPTPTAAASERARPLRRPVARRARRPHPARRSQRARVHTGTSTRQCCRSRRPCTPCRWSRCGARLG